MRTREQVSAYLLSKLDEELTPQRLRGLETAYRLFGLLPDTLPLKSVLLDIYTEQVAGYLRSRFHDLLRRRGRGPVAAPAGPRSRDGARPPGPVSPARLDTQGHRQQRPAYRGPGHPRGPGDAGLDRRPGAGAGRLRQSAVLGDVSRPDPAAAGQDAGLRARAAGGPAVDDLPLSRRGGVHALVGIVAPRRHAALRPADACFHRADPPSGALREGRPAGGARVRGAGRHLRGRPRRE